MSQPMRRFAKAVLSLLVRCFGSTIRCTRTGRPIGRALMFPWRGRILILGLNAQRPVRPVFESTDGVVYWKQRLAFEEVEAPDFPRETGDGPNPKEGT